MLVAVRNVVDTFRNCDAGTVSLDGPVVAYVPDCMLVRAEATASVAQLLQSGSGGSSTWKRGRPRPIRHWLREDAGRQAILRGPPHRAAAVPGRPDRGDVDARDRERDRPARPR
jgi:CubicO group peptidase (beta-lactamase class C family)